MISEGSCDTEDWSNDAENSALLHRNNYILKYIRKQLFYIIIIIHNAVFTVFYFLPNRCSLDKPKKLLSKTLKNLKVLNVCSTRQSELCLSSSCFS